MLTAGLADWTHSPAQTLLYHLKAVALLIPEPSPTLCFPYHHHQVDFDEDMARLYKILLTHALAPLSLLLQQLCL